MSEGLSGSRKRKAKTPVINNNVLPITTSPNPNQMEKILPENCKRSTSYVLQTPTNIPGNNGTNISTSSPATPLSNITNGEIAHLYFSFFFPAHTSL